MSLHCHIPSGMDDDQLSDALDSINEDARRHGDPLAIEFEMARNQHGQAIRKASA